MELYAPGKVAKKSLTLLGWLMLVIPAPGRLRQEDCSEFKALLGYIIDPSSKHQSKMYIQMGKVMHTSSPSIWEVEQESQEFKVSLSFIVMFEDSLS